MSSELVKVAVVIYKVEDQEGKEQHYVFVPELVPFYQSNLKENIDDETRLKTAIQHASWRLNNVVPKDPETSHLNQARRAVERCYQQLHESSYVLPYSITEEWIDTYVFCDNSIEVVKKGTLYCTISDYKPSSWEKFFPAIAIALGILVTTGPVVALAIEFAAPASLGLMPILLYTLGLIVGTWKQNYDEFEDRMKKISRDLERYYRDYLRLYWSYWGNFSFFRVSKSLLAALITGSMAQYSGWNAFKSTQRALFSLRDIVQHLPRGAAWLLHPMTLLVVAALTGIVVTIGTTISVLYAVTGSWFGWGIRDPRYALGLETIPEDDNKRKDDNKRDGNLVNLLDPIGLRYTPSLDVLGKTAGSAPGPGPGVKERSQLGAGVGIS